MNPKLYHKHLLNRAEIKSPPLEYFDLDAELGNLVKHIDMKILSGPHTAWCWTEGNMGWSGTVIIETSSITFHSWIEPHYPVIQLDLYSCKDINIKTVLLWLDQFDPKKIDYKFIDRENEFIDLAQDKLSYL